MTPLAHLAQTDRSLADIETVPSNSAPIPATPNPAHLVDARPCRAPARLGAPAKPLPRLGAEPGNCRPGQAGPMTAESMCAHRERRQLTGSMWRKR